MKPWYQSTMMFLLISFTCDTTAIPLRWSSRARCVECIFRASSVTRRVAWTQSSATTAIPRCTASAFHWRGSCSRGSPMTKSLSDVTDVPATGPGAIRVWLQLAQVCLCNCHFLELSFPGNFSAENESRDSAYTCNDSSLILQRYWLRANIYGNV